MNLKLGKTPIHKFVIGLLFVASLPFLIVCVLPFYLVYLVGWLIVDEVNNR